MNLNRLPAWLRERRARPNRENTHGAKGYRSYRGARRPVSWGRRLLLAAVFAALAGGMWVLCRTSAGASALLRKAGLSCAAFLSRVTGVIPFPLSEWVVGGLVLFVLLSLILPLVRRRWRDLGRSLCRVIFLAALGAFLFVFLYMIQHTAPSLASRMGLAVDEYSLAQLEEYTAYSVEQVNALASSVPRDEKGDCDFGSVRDLSRQVRADYAALEQEIPALAGPKTGLVKESLLGGRIMSLVDLAGYFFPWTGESVISSDVVDSHRPFDLAHEAAHARGLGPEAECNFAAFLSCAGSEDVRMRYSAWLLSYIYSGNALYAQDRDRSRAQYAALCDEAKHDLTVLNESLKRFEGPLTQAGSAVNNALIQATGQPDGIRSYGRVVDLLLAYYYAPAE